MTGTLPLKPNGYKRNCFLFVAKKNTIPFFYDSAGNIMLCDDNTMAHNTYYLVYDERVHQTRGERNIHSWAVAHDTWSIILYSRSE